MDFIHTQEIEALSTYWPACYFIRGHFRLQWKWLENWLHLQCPCVAEGTWMFWIWGSIV